MAIHEFGTWVGSDGLDEFGYVVFGSLDEFGLSVFGIGGVVEWIIAQGVNVGDSDYSIIEGAVFEYNVNGADGQIYQMIGQESSGFNVGDQLQGVGVELVNQNACSVRDEKQVVLNVVLEDYVPVLDHWSNDVGIGYVDEMFVGDVLDRLVCGWLATDSVDVQAVWKGAPWIIMESGVVGDIITSQGAIEFVDAISGLDNVRWMVSVDEVNSGYVNDVIDYDGVVGFEKNIVAQDVEQFRIRGVYDSNVEVDDEMQNIVDLVVSELASVVDSLAWVVNVCETDYVSVQDRIILGWVSEVYKQLKLRIVQRSIGLSIVFKRLYLRLLR